MTDFQNLAGDINGDGAVSQFPESTLGQQTAKPVRDPELSLRAYEIIQHWRRVAEPEKTTHADRMQWAEELLCWASTGQRPFFGTSDRTTLYCSFCGKSQHEVRKLIAGPGSRICNECTALCSAIVAEDSPDCLPVPTESSGRRA